MWYLTALRILPRFSAEDVTPVEVARLDKHEASRNCRRFMVESGSGKVFRHANIHRGFDAWGRFR